MTRTITLITALVTVLVVNAGKFIYKFNSIPLSQAIREIAIEHPELDINFIYNELENYKTSAKINTYNPYDALRQAIGLNPVTVVKSKDTFYIEALQHGKHIFSGQILDEEDEPLIGATIRILNQNDSVVITYGVSDNDGFFTIPCDKTEIILKFSCIGYENLFIRRPNFKMGKIHLKTKPTILKNITIEPDYASISADKNIYVPTYQQKKSAQNATDLLLMMAIPQIVVDPRSKEVNTNNGNGIGVYIDYIKATEEEKDALDPSMVARVEYLVFPTDPRFAPDKYVINFILKNQKLGGYIKTTGTGVLVGNVIQGQLYSKVAYKRMIYDFNVTNRYVDRGHTGTEVEQIYKIPFENTTNEIFRYTELEDSRLQMNNLSTSLRAVYSTDNVNISNKFSLITNYNPHSDNSGNLFIKDPKLGVNEESPFFNKHTGKRINPQFEGNYYFSLNKGFSFNIQPFLYYHKLCSNRIYKSTQTEIITDAKDYFFQSQIQTALSKSFNIRNTVALYLIGIYIKDKVIYSGNTNSIARFFQQGYSLLPSYNFSNGKINIQVYGGVIFEYDKIDNYRSHSILPLAQFNIQYGINDNNTVGISAIYNVKDVGLSNKTPDILQENEYLYRTGNPLLKNIQWTKIDLEYNNISKKSLSFSTYCGWIRNFKYVTPVYEPILSNDKMLRSLINGGDYQNIYIGTNATLKFFKRSLILNIRAKYNFEKLTGVYALHNNYLSLGIFATYYIKNFYLTGFYYSPYTEISSGNMNANLTRGNSFYSFGAGWSNSHWNITIIALNPFRNKWPDKISWLNSPSFTQNTTIFNTDTHQSFKITASYTFQFGKKIKQKDEIQELESSGSAILME